MRGEVYQQAVEECGFPMSSAHSINLFTANLFTGLIYLPFNIYLFISFIYFIYALGVLLLTQKHSEINK